MMNLNSILDLARCPACKAGSFKVSQGAVCTNCKAVYEIRNKKIFFDPSPLNIEENTKGSNYELWSNWRKANFEFYKKELETVSRKATVLDLGAGPVQFRDLLDAFENYVGVDFYPYEKVTVIRDLTKELPFKDKTFDVIILSNTIEHIPNTDFLLSECSRILRKGGKLLATVPFLMKIHQAPYDFNRYTHYQLERLHKSAGFDSVKVIPLGEPFDVYQKFERQFFNILLHSKLSKNRTVHYILYFLAKALWKIKSLANRAFMPLYRKCLPTGDYTEGYGVVAIK